jgi:hypothetical protein
VPSKSPFTPHHEIVFLSLPVRKTQLSYEGTFL